jgi:hypothetical protein
MKMKNKLVMKSLALAAIVLFAASSLTAQTRVKFRRGTNSATVSGKLGRGGARSYVLRASAGQSLTATLSSGNGKVDFTQGSVHDTQFNRTLDYNGDVEIMIDNHGDPTNYTLTISIQ